MFGVTEWVAGERINGIKRGLARESVIAVRETRAERVPGDDDFGLEASYLAHDATASADRNTLRPAPATSIQGLLVSVFASEAGYALALAVAVPYGTGAVAIAIVVMCLLAILIKTRISRGR